MQELLKPKKTVEGRLTGVRHSSLLFSQIASRLADLGRKPETAEARAEVGAVLACPWWGLRINAMKVIASWGGPGNRRWLSERALQTLPRPPDIPKYSERFLDMTRAFAAETGSDGIRAFAERIVREQPTQAVESRSYRWSRIESAVAQTLIGSALNSTDAS